MWASNFDRTNLPSGIIYAFAMWHWDEHTEEAYDETIEIVQQELSQYKFDEWDGDKKIIWFRNVTLWNRVTQEWECVSVNVLVEHGYHEGARLDISIDDILDLYPQLSKANKKRIDYEIRFLEKLFKKVCPIKLRKVWNFSNWEWVYETIK